VEAVVWATGFHSDYSWIRVTEAVDERGAPVHRRGVTPAPGLYFLGMHNQYSRGSSLIGFVRHDAAFIVERICAQRAANPRRV
jgi:putative flavoprotein involved in K+ transport